jgi:intracellular sulfur oxidation DsrE/DsrF family protein
MNFIKNNLLILCVVLSSIFSNAQTSARESKATKLDPFIPILEYPLIKGTKWTGVLPVKNVNDKPKANKVYKLLFDFSKNGTGNGLSDKPNEGLEEIARILNLHAASGILPKNLKAVVIVHSGAYLSILNNTVYQKKFNSSNPNASLIDQMQKVGVQFILCGQTMVFSGSNATELYNNIFVAEAAKVAITKYQTAGYVSFIIN